MTAASTSSDPMYASDRRAGSAGASLTGGDGYPDRVLPEAVALQADPLRQEQRALRPECGARRNPAPSAQPWRLPSRLHLGLRGAPVVSSTRPSSTSWRTLAMPSRAPTRRGEDIAEVRPGPQNERRPGARADSRWREISVDAVAGAVTRPAGVRLNRQAAAARDPPRTWPRSALAAIAPSSSTPAATCASAGSGHPSVWSASTTRSTTVPLTSSSST